MPESDFILVQLSDTHLDLRKPEHRDRWHIIREAVRAQKPDLILVSGDISDDGMFDSSIFHANLEMLGEFDCPSYVVPGNHDIGNKIGVDDPVNMPIIEQWINAFGNDRFAVERDRWRFIGLNSQILGSGFPREDQQFAWLDQQLDAADAAQQNVVLCQHMPIYLNERDENVTSQSHYWIPSPESRDALLARADRPSVKLIMTGHVHWYRQTYDAHHNATCIWCPSSSGLVVTDDPFPPNGESVGFMTYHFSDSTFTYQKIELALEKQLIHFDATYKPRND